MDKKVKVAIAILVIVMILVAGVITAYYILDAKNKENNVINTNQNILNNKEENVVNQNILNKIEQEKEQNTTTNTTQEVVVFDGTEEDLIDKAIAIVKEDWGEDNSVYFDYAGIDNDGRCVISVNDKETTQVLEWYTVNVMTGQFIIQ